MSFPFIFQNIHDFHHLLVCILQTVGQEEVQGAGGRELLLKSEPPWRGSITSGRDEDGDRMPGGFGLEGGKAGKSLR